MRNLFVLVMFFAMFSCSTPEKSLISNVDDLIESKFIPQLKDPSSYQKVNATIFDTLTVEKYVEKYKDVTKSEIDKLKSEHPNGIIHIKIVYTYRAKNGFGALDVYEKTFRYFPDTNELGM